MKHLLALLIFLGTECATFCKESVSTDTFNSQTEESVMDLTGDPFCSRENQLSNAPVLRKAGEMSMYTRDSDYSIRVTVCPTRGKPVVLRMYKESEKFFIEVKRLSGRGGYDMGNIELVGNVLITSSQAEDLIQSAEKKEMIDLCKIPPAIRSDLRVLDGYCWSLEVRTKKEYRMAELFGPLPSETDITGASPYLTKVAIREFDGLVRKIFTISKILLEEN